jgi:hypothetical protein
MFIELRTMEPLLTPSTPTSAATSAAAVLTDRRAGALLTQRRRGAEASAARRGRLASRNAVTAVRSGGRLVVLPTREAH